MAQYIDVDIEWEGTSIIDTSSPQVLSYNRTQEMCSGEGFLTIEVIKPELSSMQRI